jgi:rhamnogalacturonan endolyase
MHNFVPSCLAVGTALLFCVHQSLAAVSLVADTSARTATVTTSHLTAKIDKDGRIKVLTYAGRDLVNGRSGLEYGKTGKKWSASQLLITTQTPAMVDLGWKGEVGELHYVFMDDLSGIYSYFIVRDMDGGQVEEMRTIYRMDPEALPNTFTMRMGPKTPPTLAQIKSSKVLQDSTFQLADGTIYTKYDSCDFLTNDLIHGLFGPKHGLWFIPVSREAYNGGPMKQELLAHVEAKSGEMIALNMLHACHLGTAPGHLPNGKIYGPWLIYLNNGSSEDAIARAKQEEASWPYTWLDNESYPKERSTVEGRLVIADGRPTDKAMVVLAEPLADGDLMEIASSYWFSAQCDSAGNFRIPHVRPGNYTLYAFATQGDVTDQFRKDNLQVSGPAVQLGTLTWTPPNYPNKLWTIGTADRKSSEFKLGDQPRSYALFQQVPANLTYTIGSSTPAKDWYYCQTGVGKWTVDFDLSRTYPGDAHLTIAVAGSARMPVVKVLVNEKEIGTLRYPNDGSTYRSSNTGGHYHLTQLDFPASLLKQGANSVAFNMISCDAPPRPPGGISYDMIKLEADGDNSPAKK